MLKKQPKQNNKTGKEKWSLLKVVKEMEERYHTSGKKEKTHRSKDKKNVERKVETAEPEDAYRHKKSTKALKQTETEHSRERRHHYQEKNEEEDRKDVKQTTVRRMKSIDKTDKNRDKDVKGQRLSNNTDKRQLDKKERNVEKSKHRTKTKVRKENNEESVQSAEKRSQLSETLDDHSLEQCEKREINDDKRKQSMHHKEQYNCKNIMHKKSSKHTNRDNERIGEKYKSRRTKKLEGTTKENSKEHCSNTKTKQPHYYSDSELEQNKTKTKNKITSSAEKSVDVSALFDFFQKEKDPIEGETNEQRSKKTPVKKDQQQISDSVNTSSVCGGGSVTEQSSIRSKLIRVLFKRVKELLKETEQLRDDRKSLTQQITELTCEVEQLKLKDEEHVSHEMKIKERLNVIANDMNITNKGTTFKEEIHSILYDIQMKYVNHWQEHEKRIKQVQSHAEDEIQSLMNNIVGKYVQINESKDRTSITSGMISNNSPLLFQNQLLMIDDTKDSDIPQKYNQPLFINTSQLSDSSQPYMYTHKDSKNLLLKVVEPQRCSSNITTTFPSFDKTLTQPATKTHHDTVKEEKDKLYSATTLSIPKDNNTDYNSDNQYVSNKEILPLKKGRATKSHISLIPKKITGSRPSLREENSSKEELKEFWRHRLLQPNPIELLRKDKETKEDALGRNQF